MSQVLNEAALDVRRIREHPLAARIIPIHGFLYDVRTGRLSEVVMAAV
jgi:carbonic anhydrase